MNKDFSYFIENKALFGSYPLHLNQELELKGVKYYVDLVNKQLTIFWGGSINTHHLFFIHSPEYKNNNSIISNESFVVTRSSDVLYDIVKNKGPKNFIIIRGLSIWSPHQLDEELSSGSWDKKVNYYLSIFDNDKNMWQILVNSQGA